MATRVRNTQNTTIDLDQPERDAIVKVARELVAEVDAARQARDYDPAHTRDRHAKLAYIVRRLLEVVDAERREHAAEAAEESALIAEVRHLLGLDEARRETRR